MELVAGVKGKSKSKSLNNIIWYAKGQQKLKNVKLKCYKHILIRICCVVLISLSRGRKKDPKGQQKLLMKW